MRPLEDFAILTLKAKRKCFLIPSESLISELLSCWTTSIRGQYRVIQVMATNISITPGTMLTIYIDYIGSVTKHKQLWSKTKIQYSHDFDITSTLLQVFEIV